MLFDSLGLSLFSLLSHVCTPQGHALLRQWFLSPLQSIEHINERQDTVAFFLEPGVQDAAKNLRQSLKKAGDVQTALNAIRRGGTSEYIPLTNHRGETNGREKRKGRL
jgi:DNA mismatch repair ATPase MutS